MSGGPAEHAGRGTVDERKLVTVLFADLVDSTALAESIDPERLRVLLGSYFGAMAGVIESWGGTVQKYVGDAIMATFGVPTVREDDAERALRAGLQMLDRLAGLNDGFETHHGVRLAVRIGVNTGDVIAPAGERIGELIVAGDAVNLAARLQQAAEPGTVLAGQRTFAAARNAMRFGDPLELTVKGKAAPVLARPLIGVRLVTERGIPGLRAPMVGRDRELEILAGLLEESVDRQEPRGAVVYGPAGMGKSRLVAELTNIARQLLPPATVLRGRCLAVGQSATYWSMGEILRSFADISLDDPAAEARLRLDATVAPGLAKLELDPVEATRTLDALALSAGLPPTGMVDGLSPERIGEELSLAWPRWASSIALDAPLVLVVEDLHWAAAQVLDLLEAILTRSAGPVLILGTARPELAEARPGFLGAREDTAQVTLRPLTSRQSAELVDRLLEEVDLPTSLRDQLLDRAEGNPFFLEELLRRLIDEGVLAPSETGWRVSPGAADVQLPDSIHGLLAARIDSLGTDEKSVLQEASVVGRVFWLAPVEAALPGVSMTVAVAELERRGLVATRPSSTIAGVAEYQFRHALIRDVAYASLPRSRRAAAHAEIGDWLETFGSERRETFVELLAEHWRAAVAGEDADLAWIERPDAREAIRAKAYQALLESGDQVRNGNALDRAAELHGQALSLAVSTDERLRAEEALGEDADSAYEATSAIRHYQSALGLATELASRPGQARLSMKIARTAAFRSGRAERALSAEEIEGYVDAALRSDPDAETRAYLLIVAADMRQQYVTDGQEDPRPLDYRLASAREALAIATSLSDLGLTADSTRGLAHLAESVDDVAGMTEHQGRLRELAYLTTDLGLRQSLLIDGALFVGEVDGRMLEAYGIATEAATLTSASRHGRLHVTAVLLWTAFRAGAWDDAASVAREHLYERSVEGRSSCQMVRLGTVTAGVLAAYRGDRAAALEILAEVTPEIGNGVFVARLPVDLLAALGETERARSVALAEFDRLAQPWSDAVLAPLLDSLRSVEDWAGVGSHLPIARSRAFAIAPIGPTADRAEGSMAVVHGDRAGGAVLLRRALDAFERQGLVLDVAVTSRLLAAAVAETEPGEAGQLRAHAATIEARLGLAGPAATGPGAA